MMNITNSRDFGEAIKNRRKSLGYTQQFLSDFSGLSISFISDLERGKPTVEFEKALFLANTLGMDLNLTKRGRD